MENWMESYKLNECMTILSMLLSFLILAVFGQRKTWIATESIMICISGLAFTLFPRQILALQILGTLGNVEIDLARFFGLTLLCYGLIWLKTRETRDGTVIISVLQSRVFASLTLVILQSVVYFGSKVPLKKDPSKESKLLAFSDQMFFLGIFPTSLWFLGNLLHLAKSYDFNSFPQHNMRINNHLKLEAMLVFVLGIICIAFPGQILKYSFDSIGNKVSLHIVRSIGSLNIGSCMLAIQAPGFLHDRDKKTIFIIRIVTCLLQLGYWCFWFFMRKSMNLCLGLILLSLLGNALVGYFCGITNIYKPDSAKPVESKKETLKVD